MADRLLVGFLFIGVVVLSFGWLSCMGDAVMMIDNTENVEMKRWDRE